MAPKKDGSKGYDGTGEGNGSTKDAFSLPSFGKLTVGPSGKFDQGSAYDAMNSEEEGSPTTAYTMFVLALRAIP